MREKKFRDNRKRRNGRSYKSICVVLFIFLMICSLFYGCGKDKTEKNKVQQIPGQVSKSSIEAATKEAIEPATKEAIEDDENAQTQENSSNNANNSNNSNNTDNSNDSNNANDYPLNTAASGGSPFAEHGALCVVGTNLVDKDGNPYQLFGMSTHGLSWFPEYVNADAFATLRSWNTNCVRLAMYTAEYNGYCTGGDKEALKNTVKQGVEHATSQGMYVIIDWHILSDGNPMTYKEEAKAFFAEMSSLYKNRDNIIYEICNEPNGADWETIKSYAQEVIPVIRANDSNAVILVGTPEWCQQVDQAAASPLGFDNIMYTLHFYAATHTDWLRQRAESAINSGLPIFVSEFGMCDASGNGGNDFGQASSWMELIGRYNLSYCCWNLANKAETSSIINSWCTKTSGWSDEDLSESGKWIVNQFQSE